MTSAPVSQEYAPLDWTSLRPYVSVVVLECMSDDLAGAFVDLERVLMAQDRRGSGDETQILALSRVGRTDTGVTIPEMLGVDEVVGFVRRRRGKPGWADPDSTFVDTVHRLTVALRRGRLVAVHTDDAATQRRLQRWLDHQVRPTAFRRLPPTTLEGALLQGEAKGLWLRGTHRRRSTKPDTKNISGIRLQDALNPFDDSSFAMASARADLGTEPERSVLNGTVGTTPRRSLVWFKAAADFTTFLAAAAELLVLLEKTLSDGPAAGDVLPHLAREVVDLSEVKGAYEVMVVDPDQLASASGVDDDLRIAAATLQSAVLEVRGTDSAEFTLDVGLDGSVSGSLAVRLRPVSGGFELGIGFSGEPTNLPPVRQVLDALAYGELLTVYYRSGHTFADGRVCTSRVPTASFPNWRFKDFEGYRITQEKPRQSEGQAIHDAIAQPGDISLFGWLVANYREGWLTCDDGSGEVADFLHVSPEGTLSVIHVKGANSDSPRRRVAAAYEIVASQASKNLIFTDSERLLDRLRRAPVPRPACWSQGNRVPDRTDFFEALNLRDATNDMRVVIVQPHLSELNYRRLRLSTNVGVGGEDMLRLHLLESLLNATRSSIVGVGADLVVVGSRA
jgi:hypothetical protein